MKLSATSRVTIRFRVLDLYHKKMYCDCQLLPVEELLQGILGMEINLKDYLRQQTEQKATFGCF